MTTETTETIRQSLIDSIESLKNEDFIVYSGFKTDIYLDPENEVINGVITRQQPRTEVTGHPA